MANESIRIRTTPGVDKNVRVKLDQDFDFLEILSLKITQEDLYQPFCSNYGVVVGRVIANKGYGIPNSKVSIFIPITDEDKKNQLIKDLYPFKTQYQKNSNGVRYNLLLSKATCTLNKPVGTFPTKEEVLDNDIVLEVFEKYYKYTTKTNYAGDFMIFGVPIGQQSIHMDLDLSDIGAASVRPYDLIADGAPEKLFASFSEFKTSTNLDSLPQIKSGNKSVDVIPLWGDTETCEIGITRCDFDTNFEIKTTSLFFGSIFTDSGKMNLNKGCNPRNDMGEEDNLKTGEGRIDMIRVKDYDTTDWVNTNTIKPIDLEKFTVDGGELIDDDGTFAFPVPMNIGHVITDEFGILVPSNDPSVGIATKGMYRFAMKFTQPNDNPKFRTATIFFPSLGVDFGGTQGMVDTGSLNEANGTQDQRFTDDISQYNKDPLKGVVYNNSKIELDFHTFEMKQLYTISHFIKKYKKGANRFSYLGIKNTDISSETNLFPFTNAVWKFDIIYYIIALFIDVVTFLIKLLIILISLCIKLCVQYTLSVTILEKDFSWNIFSFCYQICPFSFLGGLIGSFNLPCENAPNGEGYQIPPGGDWHYCNPGGCGTSFGCSCPVTCSNEFTLAVTTGAGGDCTNLLEDWKCCAKLTAAENRNVIRRSFNDAWVLGTAYLFQFKYKKSKSGKEKFCGPGADHLRGDNYVQNKCCIDTDAGDTCDKCLIRGPKTTTRHNQFRDYHYTWHNYATDGSTNGNGTGSGYTGAVDIGDLIYCNALMSTKIVSLGRIEMCEETLEQIDISTQAGQALHEYAQTANFYTGTFYENGWDKNYWVQTLKESSYEDPFDVLMFLGRTVNCNYRNLFWGSGAIDGYPCHEYELLDNPYFIMKEVSKIYADIELSDPASPPISPNDGEFNPPVFFNPYADQTTSPQYGGFTVNKDIANRFSPCGTSYGCNGWPTENWPLNGSIIPEDTLGDGWDKEIGRGSRNNQNSRSNIPYYYFGINPGKTAINKLKKKYFVIK